MRLLAFLACLALSALPALAQEGSSSTPTPETAKTDDLNDIPYEYFEEHDDFLKYCMADPTLTQYYNCDCLAYEFLNKRIEVGLSMPRGVIMQEISKKCADATDAAGYEYQECMASAPILPANKKPEEFCKCLANTYARLFEAYELVPESKAFVELKSRAYIICADPQLGKTLYPFVPKTRK